MFILIVPAFFKFFGFYRIFAVLPFFLLGYCIKKYDIIKKLNSYPFVSITVSFITWILFGIILNSKITIYGYDYENYLFLFIGASAATIFFILIFSRIKNAPKPIIVLGQSTLFIMSTHIVIRVFMNLNFIQSKLPNMYSGFSKTIYACTVTAIILFVEYFIILYLKKFKKINKYLGLR